MSSINYNFKEHRIHNKCLKRLQRISRYFECMQTISHYCKAFHMSSNDVNWFQVISNACNLSMSNDSKWFKSFQPISKAFTWLHLVPNNSRVFRTIPHSIKLDILGDVKRFTWCHMIQTIRELK